MLRGAHAFHPGKKLLHLLRSRSSRPHVVFCVLQYWHTFEETRAASQFTPTPHTSMKWAVSGQRFAWEGQKRSEQKAFRTSKAACREPRLPHSQFNKCFPMKPTTIARPSLQKGARSPQQRCAA